jgi:hypothetical protein
MEQKNYITLRVRKGTQRKLKVLSALLGESMLDTLERLVTQELERVQQGEANATDKEDQAQAK